MPDTGWIAPGTVTGTDWTALASGTLVDAVASDDAFYAQSAGSNVNYLICSGFGITLPAGAIPEGHEVRIRSSVVGAYVGTALIGVRLSKDAANPTGNERTGTITGYPPDVTVTLGSPTDMWAGGWTDTEVEDNNYALLIRLGTGSAAVTDYRVGDVDVKVYYSEPTSDVTTRTHQGQMLYIPDIAVANATGMTHKDG
jgi:hypothetical protein